MTVCVLGSIRYGQVGFRPTTIPPCMKKLSSRLTKYRNMQLNQRTHIIYMYAMNKISSIQMNNRKKNAGLRFTNEIMQGIIYIKIIHNECIRPGISESVNRYSKTVGGI